MNNKKPNRQQVNKVRRKADEQDITLGSRSSLPEDEVKSLRKRGAQLEIKHSRKPSQGEQEPIRTGRAPKKEKKKKPYDRHAPRKSEVEKEYTHELRKIRARLRYREKQGFFVKWETLPTRPSRITQASIEKLQQFKVQLNDLGEIEVKRVAYGEQARELRIRKQDLPNYDIKNEPNFVPPQESAQQFNVLENVRRRLEDDINILTTEGVPLNHMVSQAQEQWWVELSNSRLEQLKEYYLYFIEMTNSSERLEYADYLMAHEEIILNDIDIIAFDSDQKNVEGALFRMGEYFIMH